MRETIRVVFPYHDNAHEISINKSAFLIQAHARMERWRGQSLEELVRQSFRSYRVGAIVYEGERYLVVGREKPKHGATTRAGIRNLLDQEILEGKLLSIQGGEADNAGRIYSRPVRIMKPVYFCYGPEQKFVVGYPEEIKRNRRGESYVLVSTKNGHRNYSLSEISVAGVASESTADKLTVNHYRGYPLFTATLSKAFLGKPKIEAKIGRASLELGSILTDGIRGNF